MLKPLTLSNGVDFISYMKADRVWKRRHRLNYARLMSRWAQAKGCEQDAVFWRAVMSANSFDKEEHMWKQPHE